MVELLLNGLGGDQRAKPARPDSSGEIICYHVDARFSTGMDDIAQPRAGKVLKLFQYVAQALWTRLRHGANILYYVPAPPLRAPLFRDLLILGALRPFFSKTVFYWHAAGLGEWLAEQSGWMRRAGHWVIDDADLSLAPSEAALTDAKLFNPKQAAVALYGIPDPHPNYETALAPLRRERLAAIRLALNSAPVAGAAIQVHLLFIAVGMEEKGLLDAVRALQILRATPGLSNRVSFHLSVAGKFLNIREEEKFQSLVKELELSDAVTHLGFVSGERKREAFAKADLLLFPTWYYAESAGLVLFEAMAAGLGIVATKWRALPEFFPPGYPGLVAIKSPNDIAQAAVQVLQKVQSDEMRGLYLTSFSLEAHLRRMREAFLSLDTR